MRRAPECITVPLNIKEAILVLTAPIRLPEWWDGTILFLCAWRRASLMPSSLQCGTQKYLRSTEVSWLWNAL